MENEEIDMLVKVVVCGESGVGKSNLLSRYLRDSFELHGKATIGVEFYSTEMKWNGKQVSVQLFDTVGQEKYRSVCSSYFRNCDGVVLVYDITRVETYLKLQSWRNLITQTAKADTPVLLVGNKLDLTEDRRVNESEAKEYSLKHGFYFMETSALSNVDNCVSQAFELIVAQICQTKTQEINKLEQDYKSIRANSLRIGMSYVTPDENKKYCCN